MMSDTKHATRKRLICFVVYVNIPEYACRDKLEVYILKCYLTNYNSPTLGTKLILRGLN